MVKYCVEFGSERKRRNVESFTGALVDELYNSLRDTNNMNGEG